ncbi:hypothetical protein N7495_007717 [Penicillium taxi]|uniref:uncharacterized protein n=1 Tax=Penicillium taxi TaxID=168475 RepID=UPI0025453007|nr:uncharacterized protein N7495_007717 [Penicillium taxi]KAJ5887676.1 hypothetical protein N7495_007717 [Penicillium taxi]
MAQTTSLAEGIGAWNPALRPESHSSLSREESIITTDLNQSHNDENSDSWEKGSVEHVDSEGEEFSGQLKTQTKPIFAPSEADSRFEEGVPLLDESNPSSPERLTSKHEPSASDPLSNDNDNPDGLLSSVKNEAHNEPHLTRKSTSQVIESLVDDSIPSSPEQATADEPSVSDPFSNDNDDTDGFFGSMPNESHNEPQVIKSITDDTFPVASDEITIGNEPSTSDPFSNDNDDADGFFSSVKNESHSEPQVIESVVDSIPISPEQVTSEHVILASDPFSNDNDDVDGFFSSVQNQSHSEPQVLESVVDDYIPASSENITVEHESSANDPFLNDIDDADEFFSSIKKESQTEPQLIESLGFEIDASVSDTTAAAELEDVLRAAPSELQAPQVQTETAEPSEEELAARWEAELSDTGEDDLAAWEAALDDDDMLLEEDFIEPSASENQATPQTHVANGLNSPFETPQLNQTRCQPIPGVYTPHQPSTSDLLSGVPIPGASSSINPAATSYFPQQPQRPVTTRGESFAEQSKQGYKSPYDLPEDLSRGPRKVITHKASIPMLQPLPPRNDVPLLYPPIPVAPPHAKNFYEELPPPPPKSRQGSSGRYTPSPALAPTETPFVPSQVSYTPAAAAMNVPSAQTMLQPPERLDPYAPVLASSAPAASIATSRYSPQPPSLQPSTKAPARYSPAPPPSTSTARTRYASQPLAVPGQTNALPFQPRTSSPLAYHEKTSNQPEGVQHQMPPSLQPSVDFLPPHPHQPSIDQGLPYAPPLPNGAVNIVNQGASMPPVPRQQTPPATRYAPLEYINDFTQRITSNPSIAPAAPQAGVLQVSPPPPRRSQTQSPGQYMINPRGYVPSIDTLPRPASVHGSGSPTKTTNPYAFAQPPAHNRGVSQKLDFIAPVDGQELDPLERWKGAPIFKFGFGGAVVSCFPKLIPRYSAAQVAPMIKPTPGETKSSQLTTWLPSNEIITQHPGPLKTKSKKKDVLAWLSSKIALFENEIVQDYNLSSPDVRKRHEEKILLWKVTKILVENDGVLEGTSAIQQQLREIIFPGLPVTNPDVSYGGAFPTLSDYKPLSLPSQPDAIDPEWIEELRNHLIQGEREKAIWSAVDRRLWGHAMLLASTLDKSIWKQVAQEFVRRDVRSSTAKTESIAALYDIFAGNVEESIDELVPPSARAGHHLISKVDGQDTTKNALDGLESWRDTLGLVLSNRSSEDHLSLLALGRLLASYGRIEAAHICFIVSRSSVFGGADDPQANIVLIGADHQRFPSALLDEDSFLLTEVYEFATSVLAGSSTTNFSYLTAFKVLYAKHLADRGRKSEAQSYCDGVASALKSTTRPSPYYHQTLFAEVEELCARLRQTNSDGSSSWISKPSMEKVSGSMWARFNSFVVGDDSDAASTGSGKAGETADFGPFANVAGTPIVSRSPSVSDIYGSYPGSGAQPIPAGVPSRYLPNQYAPNASPEQFRSRSSLDSQRSFSGGVPFGQRRSSQDPTSPIESHGFPAAQIYSSPGVSGYQSTPPQSSYMPLAPVEEDSSQSPAEVAPPVQPVVNGLFYQPPGQDPAPVEPSPYYQGPPGMPQSESPSYLPPASSNSYEPPSYSLGMNTSPEVAEESPEVAEPNPKKKSFMDDDDDDDDLASRAAAIQKSQKAENDRKADEAFRKAAEEDAKRDSQQPGKKGWFGGWFGGKKETDNKPAGSGPIRAKLGDDSSFYYDKELKKWVNKKDPDSAAPVRATPPPPRASAPPSRTNSGILHPPAAPMSAPPGSRPQSSSSDIPLLFPSSPAGLGVPPPTPPTLGNMPRSVSTSASMPPPNSLGVPPPPRPLSSLSNAQSIDDLIGAPQARKGNVSRNKKKGRYVDVMAK